MIGDKDWILAEKFRRAALHGDGDVELNAICERLELPPDDTEQGLTEPAWDAVMTFVEEQLGTVRA